MNRRAHRLSIGAALLAGGATMAAAPLSAESVEKPAPAAATTAPAQDAAGAQTAPDGNQISAIPLAKLTITRDRPIFSPSRRPPPPPAAAPIHTVASVPKPVKTEPERPPLTLVGTIVGANDSIAVFLERSTRAVVRLHTSESHQGWVLRSIEGREARLEKGPDSAVLALPPPGGSPEIATAEVSPEQVRRPRR